MHRLIRILVFAKDAEGALDAAHEVAHKKLGYTSQGGPFDYYIDFTHDTTWQLGKGRWGPIPPVLQVSTARFPTEDPRGMEQTKAAFELIREEFKDMMAQIRYHVANYTDDELFKEVPGKGEVEIDGVKLNDDPGLFQYYCEGAAGRSQDLGSYLYDFKGHCVTRRAHFQRIITDSDENPYYIDESEGQNPNWGRHIWNQPLWIVPFDVHY